MVRGVGDVLNRLQKVKPLADKSFMACCPAHDDKTPSLHISQKGDAILLKCQAGCDTQAVLERLGLTMADLFIGEIKQSPMTEATRIVATYDYKDEDGKLLYQVLRYASKDFRQRRPDGNGGWLWNLKSVKRVLYRLPEVLKTVSEGRTVYIPEGEKDCDNLAKIGLTATTNSGGAEKWRTDHAEALTGASVVILPDRDAPGQRHAVQVANSLHGKAKFIKVLELPDRDGHHIKDISDWLAAGGTVAELEGLTARAPEHKPKENDGVSLVCMAEVEPESVSWLWYPYIPLGKLTLIDGDPGVGKSWASLAIAAAVSLGKGLPGAESVESASVVLAQAEDGLGDTVRPRLDNMGADVTKIHAIKGVLDFGNDGLAVLETYIQRVKPALVIVDPLVAYIGANVDLYRANETRAVMAKLAVIAEKHSCAILVIRHLTKGGKLKPIYAGLGSIDFAGAVRSMLLASRDPDNHQKRGIVHTKSNVALEGAAIGYELRDGGFHWTGESDLTAARILAVEDSGDIKSARDEAVDFIRDELAAGAVDADQVWRDARAAGLSEATLKRAKAMLGVITRRHGETGKRGGGKFTWELPGTNLEVQKDLEYQDAHIKESDTLNNPSFNDIPLLKADDTLNIPDVLGMPVEKALEIWRSQGAPVIHLGPGENCLDMEKLLSNPNIKPEHLRAVKAWLEKH